MIWIHFHTAKQMLAIFKYLFSAKTRERGWKVRWKSPSQKHELKHTYMSTSCLDLVGLQNVALKYFYFGLQRLNAWAKYFFLCLTLQSKNLNSKTFCLKKLYALFNVQDEFCFELRKDNKRESHLSLLENNEELSGRENKNDDGDEHDYDGKVMICWCRTERGFFP